MKRARALHLEPAARLNAVSLKSKFAVTMVFY